MLRQFAIDWGLDFPSVRGRFRARGLHPVRPGDDDDRRPEFRDDEATPQHTGVPVGEETAQARPTRVEEEEAEAVGLPVGPVPALVPVPVEMNPTTIKEEPIVRHKRGKGRFPSTRWTSPSSLPNSGGAPIQPVGPVGPRVSRKPVIPPRSSTSSSSGLAQAVRIAGEIGGATAEAAGSFAGGLGSAVGGMASGSAAAIEGTTELASVLLPAAVNATIGTVRFTAGAVMTAGRAAQLIGNWWFKKRTSRGGQTTSSGSASNIHIVRQSDVDDAIDRQVGATPRRQSGLPGSDIEESQQNSLLSEAAAQAASSSSASTRRSQIASEARGSLAAVEGSGSSSSSSSSGSTSRGATPQHFDISSPRVSERRGPVFSPSTPLMPMNLQYGLN